MGKCVICGCKSDDLKSYTVEYGYYEGREYSSKSHNSTYTSNDLSYRPLGTVTKEVCTNCIKNKRKTTLWLSLIVLTIIVSLGLLTLIFINSPFEGGLGALIAVILFSIVIVLACIEKIKVDDTILVGGFLWKKIEPIVKEAYYPLSKSDNPLMNGSMYNKLTKIVTDDGSDITVETFQKGADNITITYRRYVDRRPVNIEDFKDKSSGIAYIPHPNKALDFTSI